MFFRGDHVKNYLEQYNQPNFQECKKYISNDQLPEIIRVSNSSKFEISGVKKI